MPIPSTTILSLDAQLSLLYAIALHYDTELSNLYHYFFMKSLEDDDTRKVNLDDIQKERRIVEEKIKERVSSIYDKKEKLRAKGEGLILNCTKMLNKCSVNIAISLQRWREHDEKVVSASYIPRTRGYIPSGRRRCTIISNQ